jgi:hypothetical protein
MLPPFLELDAANFLSLDPGFQVSQIQKDTPTSAHVGKLSIPDHAADSPIANS